MKITVNQLEVEVFPGATVRDALRLAAKEQLAAVKADQKKVFDSWGNERELDGEISDGETLFVR